ncbi:MAG TPA: hypothetical protein VF593_04185 [Chthoniobacteraceae bacterium]|jgi:lipoate-protein ligase A
MLLDRITEVLDPEPHDAALNMAIDEVLLTGATTPILRLYGWARPALSFGYFVRFAEVEREACRRDLVRRWTGGGVVLHGGDLTYTLIVPRAHPFFHIPARESYLRIHRSLAELLTSWEEKVTLTESAAPKISESCFANPAEADLLVGEQKIAGAAQRRTSSGLLHQGSIQNMDLPEETVRRFASAFSPDTSRRELTAAELAAARELREEKYGSSNWLHRF